MIAPSTERAERFRRADAVLDAALDLDTGAQAAYVARACGDDRELCAEVLALLHAHHRADGFIDGAARPIAALVAEASTAPDPVPNDEKGSASGRRIGPYRVLRELGRGGMGVVYLAERDDGQYRRRVAVKVLRATPDGDELHDRFLAERQILASLSHPHIAQLLDGGVSDGELPYLVMEYVDGLPITDYCDRHRLTVDARLRLFADVCAAVQHAHQNLVLHRDLKPGNVLVTETGEVKLLDFGIAKLLDPTRTDVQQPVTRTAFRVMTPAYASPEQVCGDMLTTASDVYALGLLLYELLTGRSAHQIAADTPHAVYEAVCVRDIERPSAAISGDSVAVATARDTTPERLRRRLRGDLELIVLTALQKVERRRYQTPADLAQDVQRFVRGHAIRARPDGAAYRFRKFVGRHRAGVAAAAALAVALAGAASRERVLRRRAEVEARKAREVESFLVGVFDVADPLLPQTPDSGRVTARELLDRGAARIDSTLGTQPEVQAELRTALGRVYLSLGLYDRAAPLLRRSLAQRSALNGPSGVDVATDKDLLGTTLMRQDRYAEAEPLLRSALADRRRLLGVGDSAIAESLDHLATLLEQRNEFAAAEPLFREVVAIRQARGDSGNGMASALGNLAQVLYRQGKYDAADPLYRRALALDLRAVGENHPLAAIGMQNVAMSRQALGDPAEAERLYRRALAVKRRTLGNAHPSVTISLNNLAGFLARERGQLEEAESLVREAIALDRQIFGDRHSYVAEGLGNLGAILRLEGDFAGSERALRQALDVDRGLFGERHVAVATLTASLAQTRYLVGDDAGAIALERRALDHLRALVGDDHRSTLGAAVSLARMLAETGRPQEAEPLLLGALSRLDSSKAQHRPIHLDAQRTLGDVLVAQGRTGEALPILDRVLATARARFGDASVRTADARLAYGSALLAAHRTAEAEPLLRAARATLDRNRRAQPRLAARADRAVERLSTRR